MSKTTILLFVLSGAGGAGLLAGDSSLSQVTDGGQVTGRAGKTQVAVWTQFEMNLSDTEGRYLWTVPDNWTKGVPSSDLCVEIGDDHSGQALHCVIPSGCNAVCQHFELAEHGRTQGTVLRLEKGASLTILESGVLSKDRESTFFVGGALRCTKARGGLKGKATFSSERESIYGIDVWCGIWELEGGDAKINVGDVEFWGDKFKDAVNPKNDTRVGPGLAVLRLSGNGVSTIHARDVDFVNAAVLDVGSLNVGPGTYKIIDGSVIKRRNLRFASGTDTEKWRILFDEDQADLLITLK